MAANAEKTGLTSMIVRTATGPCEIRSPTPIFSLFG